MATISKIEFQRSSTTTPTTLPYGQPFAESTGAGSVLLYVGDFTNNAVLINTADMKLVASPTPNDIILTDATGQAIDSGYGIETSLSGTSTKIPNSAAVQAAINSAVANVLKIQGTWNASTNIPTLTAGIGTEGFAYIVSVAGAQTTPSGVSTSYAVNDVIFYTGTIWDRIPATPGLSTVLASANIYVGNASGVATAVAVTGDVAINNTGVTTIQPAAVTGSKIAATTIAAGNIINNTITATQIANNTITATQIANATITGTQLAASVAGNGLQGGAGSALSVKADTTTGAAVAPLSVTANGAGVAIDNSSIVQTSGVISVVLVDGGIV